MYQSRLALSIGVGSEEIRFWNLENIKPIFEGSKDARKKAKVTQKSTKLKNKASFFAGFGNDLNVNIDKNLHSSEDEEESENSENETENPEMEIPEDLEKKSEKILENPEVEIPKEMSEDFEKISEKSEDLEKKSENIEIIPEKSECSKPQKRLDKNSSNYKNKRRKKNVKPIT